MQVTAYLGLSVMNVVSEDVYVFKSHVHDHSPTFI